VPIPGKNVHRIPAELDAEAAAREYEQELREFFQLVDHDWPRFDLIFLGLGDDGHTASLFPGSKALTNESNRVTANWVETFQTFRITLTYPVLNHAEEIIFLVSGASKAQILSEVLRPGAKKYPAQGVEPKNGRLLWLADKDAGSLLRFAAIPTP
jgi:6-phosphogluconolactonase